MPDAMPRGEGFVRRMCKGPFTSPIVDFIRDDVKGPLSGRRQTYVERFFSGRNESGRVNETANQQWI